MVIYAGAANGAPSPGERVGVRASVSPTALLRLSLGLICAVRGVFNALRPLATLRPVALAGGPSRRRRGLIARFRRFGCRLRSAAALLGPGMLVPPGFRSDFRHGQRRAAFNPHLQARDNVTVQPEVHFMLAQSANRGLQMDFAFVER